MGADPTAWLLDSDPALRWQVERDLLDAPAETWQATRARVQTEGFGARLLALQDADGQWASGPFFPGGFDFDTIDRDGQPWTATTWTLNSLRDWGVAAEALGDTPDRLAHCRWEYEDLPYWDGEVDCCINAWTLANGVWLGVDVSGIADWFAEHQLADGGWNCEWVEGSVRSSFHSTLNALKGLLAYEQATGHSTVRQAGEEYLLRRALSRRLSTGELVGPWVTRFRYPHRWVYSALNAADYFRAADVRDERMSDAIDMVRAARQPDGRWLQGPRLPGAVWFDVDVAEGEPSKWLTLFGTRVLRWWDAAD